MTLELYTDGVYVSFFLSGDMIAAALRCPKRLRFGHFTLQFHELWHNVQRKRYTDRNRVSVTMNDVLA